MSPKTTTPLNLEFALLGLLVQHPRHGYDLYKELTGTEGLGLVWHVKQAHLYALLEKLETNGMVTSRLIPTDTYPPRKEYQITREGHKAFESWMLTPVVHGRELRQDFLAKYYFANQYGEETSRRVLEGQRNRLLELQVELEKKNKALDSGRQFEKQVYQFRMKQLQAMLEWLDACMIE